MLLRANGRNGHEAMLTKRLGVIRNLLKDARMATVVRTSGHLSLSRRISVIPGLAPCQYLRHDMKTGRNMAADRSRKPCVSLAPSVKLLTPRPFAASRSVPGPGRLVCAAARTPTSPFV